MGNTIGSFFALEAAISCVAWNSKAVAHHNLQIRQQKADAVLALCRQYTVAAFLEAHASILAQQNILATCLRTHFLSCSKVQDSQGETLPDAGGMRLLLGRTLFSNSAQFATPSTLPHLRQRYFAELNLAEVCTCQFFLKDSGRMVFPNPFSCFFVHNCCSSCQSTNHLIMQIDKERLDYERRPNKQSLVLMGDFNPALEESGKISVLDASSLSDTAFPYPPRSFSGQRNKLFGSLTEGDIPMPSHVSSSTLSPTRINRLFFAAIPSHPSISRRIEQEL